MVSSVMSLTSNVQINNEQKVQECDATGLNIYLTAWLIKTKHVYRSSSYQEYIQRTNKEK
jgi:hypothetical protein